MSRLQRCLRAILQRDGDVVDRCATDRPRVTIAAEEVSTATAVVSGAAYVVGVLIVRDNMKVVPGILEQDCVRAQEPASSKPFVCTDSTRC